MFSFWKRETCVNIWKKNEAVRIAFTAFLRGRLNRYEQARSDPLSNSSPCYGLRCTQARVEQNECNVNLGTSQWTSLLTPVDSCACVRLSIGEVQRPSVMALETWVTGASWLMLLLAPVTAVSLLCWSPAPYGRHHKKEWGAGLNPKVAWMTQEAPSCLLPLLLLARAPRDLWAGMRPDQATLIAMFLAHYVRRSFAYPLLLRGGKPTALAPWLLAIVFCCWNGFIQGASLIYFWPRQRRLWDWKWLLGASLWGLGWAGNLHSDHLLRCLRHPGEQGYKIPRGGLFEYVSAANYLAESVEWLGFAIACWSLPAAAFAAFTLSNLGPRALQHHRWYQDRFGSAYPPQRTAFLPFLL